MMGTEPVGTTTSSYDAMRGLTLLFSFSVPTSPNGQTSSELARGTHKRATMVCNGPEPNLVLWKCLFVSFCFHPFAMFFTFRFVPSSPIFLDVPFSFPCMPPGFSALLLDFCMNFCFAMILTFSRASIEP